LKQAYFCSDRRQRRQAENTHTHDQEAPPLTCLGPIESLRSAEIWSYFVLPLARSRDKRLSSIAYPRHLNFPAASSQAYKSQVRTFSYYIYIYVCVFSFDKTRMQCEQPTSMHEIYIPAAIWGREIEASCSGRSPGQSAYRSTRPAIRWRTSALPLRGRRRPGQSIGNMRPCVGVWGRARPERQAIVSDVAGPGERMAVCVGAWRLACRAARCSGSIRSTRPAACGQ
jgi:hypothetical protein